MFSPDGRWIAFTSDESGHYAMCVRSASGGGERWQVSVGGEEPVWSADGRELFYRDGSRWMAVAITTADGFQSGQPRLLFEGPYLNVSGRSFDVSPDGRRFLVLRPAGEQSPPTQVNLVTNWFEELRRRVPAR